MFFVMKNGGMTTSQYYKEFSSDEQVKALIMLMARRVR